MKIKTVQIAWVDPTLIDGLALPAYESELAAGMDIRAAVMDSLCLPPGSISLIPTNIKVAIPNGYEIQVRPRSGLAIKKGVTVVNSPGTIDADYRGEVKVGLINLGKEDFVIGRGDRIAQLILAPVVRASLDLVVELDNTERGTGGFGHTGV